MYIAALFGAHWSAREYTWRMHADYKVRGAVHFESIKNTYTLAPMHARSIKAS